MSTPLWAIKGMNKIFKGVSFRKEKASKGMSYIKSKGSSLKSTYKKQDPMTKAIIIGTGLGVPVKAGIVYGAYKMGQNKKDNKKG